MKHAETLLITNTSTRDVIVFTHVTDIFPVCIPGSLGGPVNIACNPELIPTTTQATTGQQTVASSTELSTLTTTMATSSTPSPTTTSTVSVSTSTQEPKNLEMPTDSQDMDKDDQDGTPDYDDDDDDDDNDDNNGDEDDNDDVISEKSELKREKENEVKEDIPIPGFTKIDETIDSSKNKKTEVLDKIDIPDSVFESDYDEDMSIFDTDDENPMFIPDEFTPAPATVDPLEEHLDWSKVFSTPTPLSSVTPDVSTTPKTGKTESCGSFLKHSLLFYFTSMLCMLYISDHL